MEHTLETPRTAFSLLLCAPISLERCCIVIHASLLHHPRTSQHTKMRKICSGHIMRSHLNPVPPGLSPRFCGVLAAEDKFVISQRATRYTDVAALAARIKIIIMIFKRQHECARCHWTFPLRGSRIAQPCPCSTDVLSRKTFDCAL